MDMSEMVDMKMDKKEKEKMVPQPISTQGKDKGPEYPYGLKIELDNESLDKMDIDLSEFDVGDNVMIMAKAKISSKSIDKNEGDDKERKRMAFQITHLCLEAGEEDEGEEEEVGWEDEKDKVDNNLKKKGY